MQRDSDIDLNDSGTMPQDHTDVDQMQTHISLESFGASLQAAAQAIFPTNGRSQYSKVFVLMICWADGDQCETLPVGMGRLEQTFDNIYHFEVEKFRIPLENSPDELHQKVSEFIKLGGDNAEHLKIIYYNGQSRINAHSKLTWTSELKNLRSKHPTVQWSHVQSALSQARSDILALLDCPYTGSSKIEEGHGIMELIAASAFSSSMDGASSHSFTKDLDAELQSLGALSSFSIGNLYDNLYCRSRIHAAESAQEYQSPVYRLLTKEDQPRSIRIAAFGDKFSTSSEPSEEHSPAVRPPQSDAFGITGLNGDTFIPPFKGTSTESHGRTPRVALAVRLMDDFKVRDLTSDLFCRWLQNIPASISQVKVEAAFHSYSSLLVVSVPVCMSLYMRKDPAIINLGPITSLNQVLTSTKLSLPTFPKDLPTPSPDISAWDMLGHGQNGPHSNAQVRELVSGINGNGPPRASELRLRKNAHLIPQASVKEPRLGRNRAFSQLSATSSISEGPEEARPMPGPDTPPLDPHRFHPHGPYAAPATDGNAQHSHQHSKYMKDPCDKKYPRISKPVELLRDSYDCVVIGSGYGGAVAASRMARAGQEVCLLERGKEQWPGEYPEKFMDAMKQFHVSGEFAPGFLEGTMVEGGDPTGLYHLICGRGQNAFVANGLGGTSLLNANVFLEADDATLKMSTWPEELQGHDKLKKYYKRAADVLEPESYPETWRTPQKLKVLEKQADEIGLGSKFYRVPQTTRFRDGPNSTGVEMYRSTGSGQDATGVNDGSKSSTLVNYLSDAWNWGAEMFCECEVRYVRKHPEEEGYLVFFAWHGSRRGAFPHNLYEDLMWIHARKCVFLGAGAIGTTEILLRSKKLGLPMSDKVGQGMSGNGDIIAFGYNADMEVNAIGTPNPSVFDPVGPTITGVIDNRDGHENPLDGFVIEEGAVPKALAGWLQTMLELMPGNQIPKGETLVDKFRHSLAQTGSRFLGPYYKKGSIERTQIYLIMSHDSNQAIMTLKNDKPILEFIGVGDSDSVKRLNNRLKQATEAVGGTFVQSPFYACLGKQEITVHPIGGACYARDGTADTGVTNHFGEVLTGHGEETHPGLIVTDAAVIPSALGVNPFATITALAERSVEYAAREFRMRTDLKTKNNIPLDLYAEPHQYDPLARTLNRHDTACITEATDLVIDSEAIHASGFGFSEVMSGYIHVGHDVQGDEIEDYETAAKTARGLCEEARFFLSVQAWDTDTTVDRPDHKAMLTGTFTCGSLPGSPFLVQRGNFHLFTVYTSAPGTKDLTYDFDMTSAEGIKFHFHGFKTVNSSVALAPWRFWSATSTLYVTISHAEGDKAVVGRGMLHIKPSDFLSEIFTLKPSGRNFLAKLGSTARFIGFFAKQSASLFLAPFVWQTYPANMVTDYINDTPANRVVQVTAADKVVTDLHIFEPRNPKIKTKNIFLIPGASVDQQIFSLPTIHVNAVNYFTRAGYRVFITVHRICNIEVAKSAPFTTFEARLDMKACLEWIRKEHGEKPIYTICHCMGAVSFACGLLDGTIPSKWILGISASQVFCNPMWSTLNLAKASAGPIPFDKLYSMICGQWFSCSSSREDTYPQQLINQILRFYPDTREEICNNVSCHRSSLIFGRLWNHRNLNEATHRQIDRFFGGVNMTLEHTLMQMGRRGVVTGNGPLFQDLTEDPENFHRLKGIPMFLFSGSDNKVLSTEATERTYSELRTRFKPSDYKRQVIQGYGHLDCWMGRHAYKDVFPFVREEVDRITRGKDYHYHGPDWKNDWKGWTKLPESGNPENEG